MAEKENVVVRSSGITFAGVLTILFIALKLTRQINWGWPWVLAPLWLGVAVFMGVFLIGVLAFVISGVSRD